MLLLICGDDMFKRFICSALAAAVVGAAVPCVSAFDGKFAISSGSVKAGEDVTLDVTVSDSTELAGLRLFVKYDASAFTLKKCEEADFSNIVEGNMDHEPYTFLWFDAMGRTGSQNGTFVRLTFTCEDDAASGDYDFSLFYDEEDCVDLYGNPLDFDVQEGYVTVEGEEDVVTDTSKTVTKKDSSEPDEGAPRVTKKTNTTTKKTTETDKDKTTTAEQSTTASDTVTSDKVSDKDKTTTTKTTDSDADSSSESRTVTSDTEPSVTTSRTESTADIATAASSSADTSADDSPTSDQQSTDTKKGLIAAISFIALCGIVLAVWLVLKIRKEK